MSWLDLIPKWLLLVAIAALGAAAAVQTTRLAAAKHTLSDLRESVLKAKEQRQAQNEEQRELERYRNQALAKETDRAFTRLEQVRRDRDRVIRAHDSLVRLRGQSAGAGQAGHRTDPSAAASSPNAAGPGLVPTELFGRSGERLRSCAAALDETRISNQLCERAYDALTVPAADESAESAGRKRVGARIQLSAPTPGAQDADSKVRGLSLRE